MPTERFYGAHNQCLHALEDAQQLDRRGSAGPVRWHLEEVPPQRLGLPCL